MTTLGKIVGPDIPIYLPWTCESRSKAPQPRAAVKQAFAQASAQPAAKRVARPYGQGFGRALDLPMARGRRPLLAPRSGMVPRKQDNCIETCFNESDGPAEASECVYDSCGWDCGVGDGRPSLRENFCADQCQNVVGLVFRPGCDDGAPEDCLYDRNERCRYMCENSCF